MYHKNDVGWNQNTVLYIHFGEHSRADIIVISLEWSRAWKDKGKKKNE